MSFSIYAFLLGNAVSYIGDILTLLAIPWFVYKTTGSVQLMGITGFCSALPLVLSAFFGSALVDRLGYKRTSVIGDTLGCLTTLLVPFLYDTIGLPFWALLVLVFIGGLLRSPADTARSVMVPELAKRAHMRLERANAYNDGVRRVSSFFGAPLAAILIGLIGAGNLLWFDAASFAFSALLIGTCVPTIARHRSSDEQAKKSYLVELKEGLQYVHRDTVIFTIIIVVLITNAIDAANSSVITPVYVLRTFHSVLPQGIMIAAFGITGFISTVIFGAIGHRFPRRLTLGICFTVGGALRFWVQLFFPYLPVLIAWYAIAGLFIGSINSLFSTSFQERISPAFLARVNGVISAGVMAGIPLGTFAIGFILGWIGLPATLALVGTIYLASTLSILLLPQLKEIDKPALE